MRSTFVVLTKMSWKQPDGFPLNLAQTFHHMFSPNFSHRHHCWKHWVCLCATWKAFLPLSLSNTLLTVGGLGTTTTGLGLWKDHWVLPSVGLKPNLSGCRSWAWPTALPWPPLPHRDFSLLLLDRAEPSLRASNNAVDGFILQLVESPAHCTQMLRDTL